MAQRSEKPKKPRVNNRYSTELRGATYAALVANDWNVRRTAREMGINNETVRSWARKWQTEGAPPEVMEAAENAGREFVYRAESVRDAGLEKLQALIPNATPAHIGSLTGLVGMLTDKIDRARGIASTTTVVRHELPDPQQYASQLLGLMKQAREDAIERSEVIDAEIVEEQPLGLPATTGE